MYRYLDKLLKAEKQKIKAAFNRVGAMGFDELNVVNTRKTTASMYNRFLEENEALYLKAAKDAYQRAVKTARAGDFDGDGEINAIDLVELRKRFMQNGVFGESEAEFYDLNLDGELDIRDIIRLKKYLIGEEVLLGVV